MSNNKTLLTHIKTDINAPSHQLLGMLSSVFALVFCTSITSNIVIGLIGFTIGGFATGILIEITQRIQRIGKAQNTVRESIMDILTTGLWPLIILRLGK